MMYPILLRTLILIGSSASLYFLGAPASLASTEEQVPLRAPSKDEAPDEPRTEGQATELEALRRGAIQRLEFNDGEALKEMPTEKLLALLDSVQDAQISEQEKRILEALEKQAFESSLAYQVGKVELGDGLAVLHLGPEFRYLDPQNASRLLVDAWGNPPGGETLGMIVPANVSPLHETDGWGVVVTYTEDGHVDDDDAEDIDYDDLLEEMQTDTEEASQLREKQGYGTMRLVGWAEPPHYDPTNHRLYWAKELAFSESPDTTLNYSIRILGRKGVLELNAVAGMSQLSQVKRDMQKVLPLAEFQTGKTYKDFDPELDEVAAYGIGGLIAGKVLAKAGIFAGLLKLLFAMKKVLILAALGGGAVVMKWFQRRREG